MNKKRKKHQKKTLSLKKVFPIFILISSFLMMIGYASVNSVLLLIEGSVYSKLEEGLHITEAILIDSKNVDIDSSKIINAFDTNLQSKITLSDSTIDTYITYKVSVYNNTDDDYYYIDSIYGDKFYDNEDIVFEVSGINKHDLLESHRPVSFNVTFTYKGDQVPDDNVLQSYINFIFKKKYNIAYTNIKNNNFPSTSYDNDSLNINLESSNLIAVELYSNGERLGNDTFSFDNNILEIHSVEDDIEIFGVTYINQAIMNVNNVTENCPDILRNFATVITPEDGKEFCSLNDNYGSSYYYRGNVTNNYAEYAGFYWRIVRINGDNSTRLIYAGKVSDLSNPLPNGYDDSVTKYTSAGQSQFSSYDTDNSDIGYMNGTYGLSLSGGNDAYSLYYLAHSNSSDSVLKGNIDSWYESNILNKYDENSKLYSNYLTDTAFCNDRRLWNDEGHGELLGLTRRSDDTAYGFGSNYTYYSPYYRFVRTVQMYPDDLSLQEQYATLLCDKNDMFTVSESDIGNGKLTYPIGTISMDEAVLAGGTYNTYNQNYYLSTGYTYWTMSASTTIDYTAAFSVQSNGWLGGGAHVTDNMDFRPVINVGSNVVAIKGNGTMNSPYYLSLDYNG